MITDQEKFKKILPLLGKWLIPVSLLLVSQANYTVISTDGAFNSHMHWINSGALHL